jgi:glutaredoxin-like protein
MAYLGEREQRLINEQFKRLVNPVKLVYFTQELECDSCRETGQLLKELSALSEKIGLEVFNFQIDREQAARYRVDKIPATVVLGDGGQDYGIRLYGMPTGYEFSSLLEAILSVSSQDSGLAPATRERLRTVSQPLHLQVLVTPT